MKRIALILALVGGLTLASTTTSEARVFGRRPVVRSAARIGLSYATPYRGYGYGYSPYRYNSYRPYGYNSYYRPYGYGSYYSPYRSYGYGGYGSGFSIGFGGY